MATAAKPEQVGKVHKQAMEKSIQSFIPITCHYDANILLDKNGNLIQVIEVTGFENNDDEFQTKNLRALIRAAMVECINSYDIAAYMHVIRDRCDIMPQGVEPFGFAAELRDAWCRQNNWDRQLSNSLYVTLVLQPEPMQAFHPRTAFFNQMSASYEKSMAARAQRLHQISDKFVKMVSRFGARKLSVQYDEESCISEPLSFFHKLIHLHNKPISLPIRDLAEVLSNIELKYQFNTITMRDDAGVRYAAVYTIKETHNISVSALDRLLQLGTQFVISECVHPVQAGVVHKQYAQTKEVLEMGRAKQLMEDNGLNDIMKADTGKPGNYCKYQLTLTIYSDDATFFQDKVRMVSTALSELGLTFLREDFNMAKCFWSQLPGNLRLLCRSRYGSILGTGAFTSIHHKERGCYNGSKWGAAITLFRNLDGNPFYFNFHRHENGNTLIVGPSGSGKTMLTRFLITQTCKLLPRIIYIDLEGGADHFLSKVGGIHLVMNQEEPYPVQILPFDISLFDNNLELMKKWLLKIMNINLQNPPKSFDSIITEVMGSNISAKEKYDLFKKKVLESNDVPLQKGLEEFLNTPKYELIFGDNIMDVFEMESIVNLDLSQIKDANLVELYLALLLAKLPASLDGRPTIIALNRAYTIFTSELTGPWLAKWLQSLAEKNAIAILTTHDTDDLQKSQALQDSLPQFATRFFLSDRTADRYFRKAYDLTELDQYRIKSYDLERRMFLLKQGDLTIISSVNLDELPEIMGVLS